MFKECRCVRKWQSVCPPVIDTTATTAALGSFSKFLHLPKNLSRYIDIYMEHSNDCPKGHPKPCRRAWMRGVVVTPSDVVLDIHILKYLGFGAP